MGEIRPRDVIRILDTELQPPRIKRLICVCERPWLFLRTNTEPIWPPHIKIRQADCNFLDWDSYVELNELVRVDSTEFRNAVARPDNPIGSLTDEVAQQIAFAAQQAPTLSDERRRIVWEGLVGSKRQNPTSD
jgi:hypothetical protein